MKVFIAGATGVLGRRLVRQFRVRRTSRSPVTVGEFFTELAARLEAPPPIHLAEGMIRMAAGATVVEFLATSTRTSNRRLRTELGWTPRYPSFREGLDQVVSEWRAEGFPGE